MIASDVKLTQSFDALFAIKLNGAPPESAMPTLTEDLIQRNLPSVICPIETGVVPMGNESVQSLR